jgi:hypothetical protein
MTKFAVRHRLACVVIVAGCAADSNPEDADSAHARARAPGCERLCAPPIDGVADPRPSKAPQVIIIDGDPSRWEVLHSVAIDATGQRIATGEGFSPVTGLAWTEAFAPDGHDLWIDRHDPGAEGHDLGNAIATAADGTVYVAGQWYSSSNTRWNAFVRALSPAGQPLWSRDGEDIGDDDIRGIAIDESRNALYVVGGRGAGGWLRRLDRAGATIWDRPLATAASDVVVDGDGRAILVGGGQIAAFDPDGTLAWTDTRADDLFAIARGDDGTIAVVGDNGLLARYASDGSRRDEVHATGASAFRSVAIGADDTIVVAGDDQIAAYTDALAPAWQRTQPDLDAQDVAIDGAGNVVVVGSIADDMAMVTFYR